MSRRGRIIAGIGLVAIVVCALGAGPAAADDSIVYGKRKSWGRFLLLYIPNRLVDLLDLFSFELGVGGSPHLNVHATRAVQLGVGTGWNGSFIKDYNRQVGTAVASEREFSVPFYTNYHRSVRNTTGTVIPVEYTKSGTPSPQDEIYASGARDFWAVGLDWWIFFFLGEFRLDVHPIEAVDFATSLVGLDLRKDDF